MNQEKLITAVVEIGPLWDVRNNLTRLAGILGAAIYLAAPDAEDPAKADIITALITVQEHLGECADALNETIKGMKILKEGEC